MKGLKLMMLMVAATLLLGATQALAASDTQNLTINATVSSNAKLELDTGTITFPDQDPDTVPSIPSSPATVTVRAKAKTSSGSTVDLKVKANGNLISGGDNIPIDNVTWTASGTGFVNGTMRTTDQDVGSWSNSGNRSGSLNFVLANSWEYETGNYTAMATFTLTSP